VASRRPGGRGREFEGLPVGATLEVSPAAGLVLGRGPKADVRLASPYLKRDHARVWAVEDGIAVDDLQSNNGTTVNGASLERAVLRSGDTLCLAGRYHFEVVRLE
jgi:pSer/pThr/pTyr-binding forkhead associated (FHA) protein